MENIGDIIQEYLQEVERLKAMQKATEEMCMEIRKKEYQEHTKYISYLQKEGMPDEIAECESAFAKRMSEMLRQHAELCDYSGSIRIQTNIYKTKIAENRMMEKMMGK